MLRPPLPVTNHDLHATTDDRALSISHTHSLHHSSSGRFLTVVARTTTSHQPIQPTRDATVKNRTSPQGLAVYSAPADSKSGTQSRGESGTRDTSDKGNCRTFNDVDGSPFYAVAGLSPRETWERIAERVVLATSQRSRTKPTSGKSNEHVLVGISVQRVPRGACGRIRVHGNIA